MKTVKKKSKKRLSGKQSSLNTSKRLKTSALTKGNNIGTSKRKERGLSKNSKTGPKKINPEWKKATEMPDFPSKTAYKIPKKKNKEKEYQFTYTWDPENNLDKRVADIETFLAQLAFVFSSIEFAVREEE